VVLFVGECRQLSKNVEKALKVNDKTKYIEISENQKRGVIMMKKNILAAGIMAALASGSVFADAENHG